LAAAGPLAAAASRLRAPSKFPCQPWNIGRGLAVDGSGGACRRGLSPLPAPIVTSTLW